VSFATTFLSGASLGRVTKSVFARQVATTFLSQALTLVLSLATSSISARWLGPTGRGQLALALLIPTMLSLFLGFGTTAANVYLIGSRQVPVAVLCANSIMFSLAGTLLGCVIVVLLLTCGLLPVIVPGLPLGFMLLGILLLPVQLLALNFSSILQGLRLITTLNVLRVLQSALIVPFLFAFVVWLKIGVVGAILASLLGNAIIMVGTAWRARAEGGAPGLKWDPQAIRPTLNYGLKAYIGNLLQFFNYRLDSFIVNAFLGPAGVGIYGVSVSLAELLWQLPNSVCYVIFPKAAATHRDAMNRFTPKVFWGVLGISFVGALVMVLFGRLAIRLIFSNSFQGAYVPLLVLLPGVLLLGAGKVLANDIAGRGYPLYNSIVAGFTLVITIVLDVTLIPKMGIVGAALASTIAYSISFIQAVVLYLAISRRKQNV
jgi:O-antigen/teichoic acid export membrane protein